MTFQALILSWEKLRLMIDQPRMVLKSTEGRYLYKNIHTRRLRLGDGDKPSKLAVLGSHQSYGSNACSISKITDRRGTTMGTNQSNGDKPALVKTKKRNLKQYQALKY